MCILGLYVDECVDECGCVCVGGFECMCECEDVCEHVCVSECECL